VGAHYREASRARANPEFVSKIECGLQELDETVYWPELLVEAGILKQPTVQELLREAEELTAIFVASAKTSGQADDKSFIIHYSSFIIHHFS